VAEAFAAFVLTGGKSARMGRDKALMPIDGVPMAKRVAGALEQAGAATVTCVGGDLVALRALGLVAVVDEWEAGPLGGVISSLGATGASLSLLAPCDLLDPNPSALRELVVALHHTDDAMVAVPVVGGVWRPLPAAIRTSCRAQLLEAFNAGERAVHRAIDPLPRVEVAAGPFADADTPEDLAKGPRDGR
jgi:molybdenum cofactor guanylyltransferase